MRLQHRLLVHGLPWALLTLATSAWAQKLDVKPGLWEITMAEPKSVMQACYTKEVLDSGFSQVPAPPGMQCRNEVRQATSRLLVTRTTCTGSMTIEGETRVEVSGPEAMAMQSSSILDLGGRKQTVKAAASYRWLRADCGTVKPFDPGKALQPR
ncbi:MAG TPA: DUF3617 family protein [Zeimonas sp.]|nr:DUF3617 family protein [Zeimonas sp.]